MSSEKAENWFRLVIAPTADRSMTRENYKRMHRYLRSITRIAAERMAKDQEAIASSISDALTFGSGIIFINKDGCQHYEYDTVKNTFTTKKTA